MGYPNNAHYYAQRSLAYLFTDRMNLVQVDEEMCHDLRNQVYY